MIAFSVVVLCSFDSGQAMIQNPVDLKAEVIPDSLLVQTPCENNFALCGSILPNEGFTNSLMAVEGINIGHAIVARSVFTGFQSAVREMKQLMLEARRG